MAGPVENGTLSTKKWFIILVSVTGPFITYFSMYGFRKPFLAGTYEGMALGEIDYKILLIVTQVVGYTLSKFLGIKFISEVQPGVRIRNILLLIGTAWVMLLFFGFTPYPYNFIWLFFNGLCLGMIWGLVFTFVEGKHKTEFLAAALSSSFIVSSGVVKSAGVALMIYGIPEFWMPFFTGLLFIPALILGLILLSRMPSQSQSDMADRTRRVPMTGKERVKFFSTFASGILMLTIIYMALNGFRDFRDNFAVEIWASLGYVEEPAILTLSEVPIAILCLVFVAFMVYVRDNRSAFYLSAVIIGLSGILILFCTLLFEIKWMGPISWMIVSGFGMYLAYIIFHTMLFERLIALFRYESNVGFLMYIVDTFGYAASVGIMLYKNFGAGGLSWLDFFIGLCYLTGGSVVVLSVFQWLYFRRKERQLAITPTL